MLTNDERAALRSAIIIRLLHLATAIREQQCNPESDVKLIGLWETQRAFLYSAANKLGIYV